MTAAPFSPPESAVPAILCDLGSPDITFRDVAHMHGATADTLTAWVTRPDIEARLAAIESAIARRARLIATNYLPSAVRTVTRILDEYNDEESRAAADPGSPRHGELRRRSRETARRAASLLLRLARFAPLPPPAPSRDPGLPPAPPRPPGAPPLQDAPSSPPAPSRDPGLPPVPPRHLIQTRPPLPRASRQWQALRRHGGPARRDLARARSGPVEDRRGAA